MTLAERLSQARRRLAEVIASGRKGKTRVRVWDHTHHFRLKTVPDAPPTPGRLRALDAQAADLGAEIARLERERGELLPRLAPRIAQEAPGRRPERLARTPRTGRWGFGLTPAYQGRRTASPEKIEDAGRWTASTLEEVALPCLKEEERGEPRRFSLGFVPGSKGIHKSKRRSLKHERDAWAREEMAVLAAKKAKEEAE